MAKLQTTRWDPFNDLPLMRRMWPRMDWPFTNDEPMKLDVFEKNGNFVVAADLPGIDMENVKVTIEDNVLMIRAERGEDTEVEEEHYYLRESYKGTLMRSMRLPPNLDTDKIDAVHKDGCLTITIPKLNKLDTMDVEIHN